MALCATAIRSWKIFRKGLKVLAKSADTYYSKKRKGKMSKKYKLTKRTMTRFGVTFKQIQAVRDIPRFGVREGDKGGWITSEACLDQRGNAWVHGGAQVYDDALVSGNARVHGGAQVYDDALVSGDAQVHGGAQVSGNAQVHGGARVSGGAL